MLCALKSYRKDDAKAEVDGKTIFLTLRSPWTVAGQTWPAGALLASNTSSIPLRQLTVDLPRPDRFLGLHFFNPVHLQPLLEVVRAETTSDAALASALVIWRHKSNIERLRAGKENVFRFGGKKA